MNDKELAKDLKQIKWENLEQKNLGWKYVDGYMQMSIKGGDICITC